MKAGILTAILLIMGAEQICLAKEREPLEKILDAPVERVYVAIVQLASAHYNLQGAVKDAYTVNFFSSGAFPYVFNTICRSTGGRKTTVTLVVSEAQGNPQVFGLAGARDKQARSFWDGLSSTLARNEKLAGDTSTDTETQRPDSGPHEDLATVTVNAAPENAEVAVDGRFAGSAPATLRLPAGDHTISITLRGYKRWERVITVTPGGTATVHAILEQTETIP